MFEKRVGTHRRLLSGLQLLLFRRELVKEFIARRRRLLLGLLLQLALQRASVVEHPNVPLAGGTTVKKPNAESDEVLVTNLVATLQKIRGRLASLCHGGDVRSERPEGIGAIAEACRARPLYRRISLRGCLRDLFHWGLLPHEFAHFLAQISEGIQCWRQVGLVAWCQHEALDAEHLEHLFRQVPRLAHRFQACRGQRIQRHVALGHKLGKA
mmetsp:Transcript_83843/g.233923  ORF Transcript_83843/g.233923 Transcript_83843/m.233923 type:complete len:212 (-) Transcript_83843:1902-2537(-)